MSMHAKMNLLGFVIHSDVHIIDHTNIYGKQSSVVREKKRKVLRGLTAQSL